jgi:DNA (cytosine-5)-methyltransferase 1
MTRPLCYDVFSGAGGAGYGYQQAGFRVIGIDNRPQSRYPCDGFIRMDAFEFFDAVERGEYPLPDLWHASPPCQAHTTLRVMWNARDHVDLVGPTRDRLRRSGVPYVIENVPGAPLIDPIRLCGSSFGLGVDVYDGWRQLRRHRLFETSFPMLQPACVHRTGTIGIYGDHARDRRRKPGVRERGIDFPNSDRIAIGRTAMGMPWAEQWRELSQAIPPAYTRFIGEQALRILQLGKEAVA